VVADLNDPMASKDLRERLARLEGARIALIAGCQHRSGKSPAPGAPVERDF
jgi:hypothetical protein